ncbi:hypothetical protein D0469_06575 [Peribacillus saganii]|uniref:Uncharacterized protein n=1 Tax=Peribacillus saganii TaxID=2303992 RepID=A0A372LQV5_9BACI|nr:hypothetical protein D0469_06575 [Peribacillus saganii]
MIISNGDPAFPKKMNEYIKESFYEKLNIIKDQYIIDIPHEYITAFISSAFFGHLRMLNFMKQIIRQNLKSR